MIFSVVKRPTQTPTTAAVDRQLCLGLRQGGVKRIAGSYVAKHRGSDSNFAKIADARSKDALVTARYQHTAPERSPGAVTITPETLFRSPGDAQTPDTTLVTSAHRRATRNAAKADLS